ncbi:family 20 glycosylhydrolase [Neoactinobaculum massilliense]|uniref:family 20 glycosylhydrolase n=1 Tax=Neoactinobaculum massilliense TaxID=2364794 RepID=UPI000F5348DB|nr:family 20 glycosylhydrolase [Neoactinobaculum massilliense]
MWPLIIPSLPPEERWDGEWEVGGRMRTELVDRGTLLGEFDAGARVRESSDSEGAAAGGAGQRRDLGDRAVEAFVLTITPDVATVTAADPTGLMYGVDALGMLEREARAAGRSSLECGRVAAAPHFAHRGVTLSASTLTYSEPFISQLLARMRKLRLNELLLEANIAEPGSPWPYWRRDQIAAIVKAARSAHIDVVPEVNAPSHMRPFLAAHPDRALRRGGDGEPDLERLDFTREDAADFYLSIVDTYADVFASSWWHMGADEFEYANLTYADFPQIGEAARRKFGPSAQPRDMFFDFINQVAHGMKARGKHLRIWNDGVVVPNIVELDRDITIEYWYYKTLAPGALLQAGFHVMNTGIQYYWSRSEPFAVDARAIYEERLEDRFDDGETYREAGVAGLRCSIWPDRAWMETENQVADEVRDGLAVTAQAGWSHTHPWHTWAEVREMLDREVPARPAVRAPAGLVSAGLVSDAPASAGLASAQLAAQAAPGSGLAATAGAPVGQAALWRIPALAALGDAWCLEETEDHYIKLREARSGRYLSLRRGRNSLGVIMDEDGRPELADGPDPAAVRAARGFRRDLNLAGEEDQGDLPWNQVIRPEERAIFEDNCQKWTATVVGDAGGDARNGRDIPGREDGTTRDGGSNCEAVPNGGAGQISVVIRAALSALELDANGGVHAPAGIPIRMERLG